MSSPIMAAQAYLCLIEKPEKQVNEKRRLPRLIE